MMDNILHIVPYTAEHGQFILSCQMNHKVLEADRHYINVEGNAKNLEQDDLLQMLIQSLALKLLDIKHPYIANQHLI